MPHPGSRRRGRRKKDAAVQHANGVGEIIEAAYLTPNSELALTHRVFRSATARDRKERRESLHG